MAKNPNNVIRTSAGVRDAMFDELDALRRGESNPMRARAAAALASQIIASVRMEIDFQHFVQSNPTALEMVGKSIQLGVN